MNRLLDDLQDLERLARSSESIRLDALVARAGVEGHAFLITVLSIPFLQPVPLFGLSTLIGSALFIIGCFYMLGQPPYLPQKMAQSEVRSETVLMIVHHLNRLFGWLSRFLRPRGEFLLASRLSRILIGLILMIHAVLLALPLPIPASNSLPAAVLFLFSLAVVERDIMLAVLGTLAMVLCWIFFAALVILPSLGLKHALPFFQSA
jgi:hypothetical protein